MLNQFSRTQLLLGPDGMERLFHARADQQLFHFGEKRTRQGIPNADNESALFFADTDGAHAQKILRSAAPRTERSPRRQQTAGNVPKKPESVNF